MYLYAYIFTCASLVPLSSDRQHMSCGACLEVKRKILSELLCAVLCTTVIHDGVHTNMRDLKLVS